MSNFLRKLEQLFEKIGATRATALRCVLDGIDGRVKYFPTLLLAILLSLCILLVSLFFE